MDYQKRQQQFLDAFLFLFLVVFDFVFYYQKTLKTTDINPYMLRDLDRSLAILSGQFPWVGPDTTPGGYSPGGFFYFLLLPSVLFIGTSPVAMVIHSMVLRTLSFAFASFFLAREIKGSLTLMFLVLSSSTLLADIPYIWINNSTYVASLMPFLIWPLVLYLRSSYKNKNALLFLSSFLLGLFLQIHLTFLYCLLIFLVCIFHREQSLGQRFKAIGICTAGVLLATFPYILSYLNSLYGPFFDGPHFQFTIPEVGDYLTRLKNNISTDRVRINELNGYLFLWQWENLFLYSYLALRILYSSFIGKKEKKIFKNVLWMTLVIGLLGAPFILSYINYRYLFVGNFLALVILAADLGKLRPMDQVSAAALIAFYFFFIRSPLRPLERRWRAELLIENSQQLCDYFNNKKISFPTFIKNSFEILEPETDNSFWYTRHCFTDKSHLSPFSPFRYFIVAPRLWDKEKNFFVDKINLPNEVYEAWKGQELHKEMETKNFVLLSYLARPAVLDDYPRLSNLTYMYEVDPGMSLGPQIQNWKNDPIFTSTRINAQEARLCHDRVFCSIYVLSQFERGELRLLITSRILQTVWQLPPVSAFLEDLKLHAVCDGTEIIVPLASRIGNVNQNISELKFSTPLALTKKLSCPEKLEIVSLSAKNQTLQFTKRPPERKVNLKYYLREI